VERRPGPQRHRSLASLLRGAAQAYALAVRGPLAEAGFDDIPRDGVFVLSAIARAELSAGGLSQALGVSKQAVSQLLDTLVLRGYVERSAHPDDRRRLQLGLSGRGAQVVSLCRAALERIDRRLAARVGAAQVEETRATLLALVELAAELREVSPSTKGE
jgi:DNA-binding MarR family transcriptional regulator